jgi:hypothetical protein
VSDLKICTSHIAGEDSARCARLAGHPGAHCDEYGDVMWGPSERPDRCPSIHAGMFARCTLPNGHLGFHYAHEGLLTWLIGALE